jgi:predicted acetyltransferase
VPRPFGQLPSLRATEGSSLYTTELGLYYALSPEFQRQGYATEAARAMIRYAFNTLRLKRIVATTTYDNAASMGVMRKLGMRIEQNPYSDPPWFQVVGILETRLD